MKHIHYSFNINLEYFSSFPTFPDFQHSYFHFRKNNFMFELHCEARLSLSSLYKKIIAVIKHKISILELLHFLQVELEFYSHERFVSFS